MFQFGEVVGLAIAVMATVYVLTNWHRILALPSLKVLLIPFFLMVAGCLTTVVEGIPSGGAGLPHIVFWQQSPQVTAGAGAFGLVFNLLEHLCLAAAGVSLLLALWRPHPSEHGTSP